jgi:signal recognition particle GTPase
MRLAEELESQGFRNMVFYSCMELADVKPEKHDCYSGVVQGGVGKTTTAVHLATYLKDLGSVILIDGDPNRSATGGRSEVICRLRWWMSGRLPID